MKDRKAMKTRRILAIICYTIGFCAYGAAGYVCWLSWSGTISDKQGFLTFLPIWIVSYWFNTFFSQLVCRVKKTAPDNGLSKKGKARFERHFNGAERSASLLLDICVCFAVYRTAELQIICL